MATANKSGFFDLFPDYCKMAVMAMGAVTVLGACGLAAYQLGLARPAATITSEPISYEGIQPIESLAATEQGQPGEEKGGAGAVSPAFKAGSYTVTTPSGINVRFEPGIYGERTGGKVRGSGVKVTETKVVEGDTWGHLAQGGWIAMQYDGVEYVVSDKEVR